MDTGDRLAVGTVLDGKYVVESVLGAGAFGEVYRARETAINHRQVAIKVVAAEGEDERADLIREIDLLVLVRHPNVVTFHHHFHDDRRFYLVMEYCPGGSLAQAIRTHGPQSKEVVFSWGARLCGALGAAHARRVIHHDIKPANLLMAEDGAIKLADFGVANQHAGTRIYQPPERLQRDAAYVSDPRVDIYALGITMLEALTGENPFIELDRAGFLRSQLVQDFVPTSLPRWIQDVILRATHPTPELRFQTAGDFAQAIRAQHVPLILDTDRIKAHEYARKAEVALGKGKWKDAEKLATRALEISPDCIAALVAAGRSQLVMRRLDRAARHLSKAVSINPRADAQKELGWLRLEEGAIPRAISLLTDHIQRHADDFEAHNLLLKCFFLADRFEAGLEFALALAKLETRNKCLHNNAVLFNLLLAHTALPAEGRRDDRSGDRAFAEHNLAVATEVPAAWSEDGPSLKSKLLFQEFSAGQALAGRRSNTIAVYREDGERLEYDQTIVSFGFSRSNDIALPFKGISRRHAAIVNLKGDVWLHDLGSFAGITVDGERVMGRRYLDGVHEVTFGSQTLRIAAERGLRYLLRICSKKARARGSFDWPSQNMACLRTSRSRFSRATRISSGTPSPSGI
jgi:tetratricopeptide (TPR) repeat protein